MGHTFESAEVQIERLRQLRAESDRADEPFLPGLAQEGGLLLGHDRVAGEMLGQDAADRGLRGEIGKHHMEGSIGNGGPLIDLSTSNGQIRIMK